MAAGLSDVVLIYAAELTAIQMAINWLFTSAQSTQEVVIFSDSLSSVQSLATRKSTSQPLIFVDAMKAVGQLKQNVTFAWIPSHTGIRGNDIVDNLAKQSTERATIDIALPLEYHQEKASIDSYVHSLWQIAYDSEHAGAIYREIESIVTGRIKYCTLSRSKEVCITRLRFGKCKLN